MAELRSVDPRSLKLNPDNPRKTAVPKEMDQQLVASINAIGLLQPPLARMIDGDLVVRAGDRRVKAAIAAGKDLIDVYVLDGNEDIDAMAAMSENLVRVSMNAVDTWRGIEKLEQQGWNDEAIANALALPRRTVLKLKLLGSLHPPMLDFMAKGSMPNAQAEEGPRRCVVGGGASAEQASHTVLIGQIRRGAGGRIRRGLAGRPVCACRRGQPLHGQC